MIDRAMLRRILCHHGMERHVITDNTVRIAQTVWNEALASVPGDDPVAWEYRAYYEIGWGAWIQVEASRHGFTVLDAVNDLKQYIERGYKYELRALYTSPQPDPDVRRKAIEECIAHAKSYLDYHAKATADYSGSCHAAMEYHLNHARAASNCLDAMRSLLNKPEGETK